ncbi:hypothetical protein [Limosilactobacillus reuteri]|nr:hypothetical protein [Limosilactobacillus reuteri]
MYRVVWIVAVNRSTVSAEMQVNYKQRYLRFDKQELKKIRRNGMR